MDDERYHAMSTWTTIPVYFVNVLVSIPIPIRFANETTMNVDLNIVDTFDLNDCMWY